MHALVLALWQQHRRAMLLPQRQHERVHLEPGQRVQRGEGLVEQQQFGLADQGAGERGTLGLTARQGEWPGIEPMGEPDLLQRLFGGRAPGGAA